jgi:peroxiredoxin
MNRFGLAALALVSSLAVASAPATVLAAATVGEPAPAFSVQGADGKTHALDEYKGKYVVLEWLNHECPYVKKHYASGNMQSLQKDLTGQGVVWLSVISSAPGTQGHATAEKAVESAKTHDAAPTAILLDEKGEVGRAFEAKVTPHMFVIGPDGKVLYKGAIDDKPTFAKDTVAGAKNYVRQALAEATAGKPVSEPSTTPYGCSVKY